MGCNYYLKYKVNSKEEYINLLHILEKQDHFFLDRNETIIELTNGYVFQRTYYKKLEDIDFYFELHIGKSSYGWKFSLCIYPELGINNLDDWKRVFQQFDIYDEYDKVISSEEMLLTITERKSDGIGLFSHDDRRHTRGGETYDLTLKWNYS